MAKQFHLDIITPTSIDSFENVEYVRIPSMNGLMGIKARHASAIIGIDIGEVKININNKEYFYATSGGFADIKNEGVQLLLETVELSKNINQKRAQESLNRSQKRLTKKDGDLERATQSVKRAKNRLLITKTLSDNFQTLSKK